MDNLLVLRELGFTDVEAQTYLYLLKHPDSTAWQIAKNIHLHRSSTYNILEKLLSKGAVSVIIKSGVKHFFASEPKRLLTMLKEKESLLEKALPKLESYMPKNSTNVIVQTYKGVEGIKTFLRGMLLEAKEFKLFGTLRFEEIMPLYVENFVLHLNEKKIKEKALIPKGSSIIPSKYSEYRHIGKEYLFPNAIIMFNDKVGIFVWNEPYHVIEIVSKEVVLGYEAHFDLLWKIGKK